MNLMKKTTTILSLMLVSSTVFAAQSPAPENITCKIQVIEMMDTKIENVVSEKTINPTFKTAGRDGSEYIEIVKNDKFEIGLTLSFLRYTPLLELTVQAGAVSTATGLKAIVTPSDSVNSTVVECSYTPGKR